MSIKTWPRRTWWFIQDVWDELDHVDRASILLFTLGLAALIITGWLTWQRALAFFAGFVLYFTLLMGVAYLLKRSARVVEMPEPAYPPEAYTHLEAARLSGATILANEARHGRPDHYHFVGDRNTKPKYTCAPHEYIAVQVVHGAADHGIEQSTKAALIPCDCGCGRSCCAHCGVDLGFIQER